MLECGAGKQWWVRKVMVVCKCLCGRWNGNVDDKVEDLGKDALMNFF